VAEIKFDRAGFAVLRVSIKHRHMPTLFYSDYKVDSGANCTTVNHEFLFELGYDEDWIKTGKLFVGDARPTLASGLPVNDCYEVVLPQINIGDWVGYNWPFITSLSVPFKFLLGTDTMAFFNWNFDYENGVCRFDLIPGKRKMLFNQSQQSIHAIDTGDTCK
jgi:hypothetical protein